jgi:hypothetical protein
MDDLNCKVQVESDPTDPDFERGLERLFAQTPAVEDAEGFTRRVEARLSRTWRLRTLGVGFAGMAGGVVAIRQLVGSGMGLRAQEVTSRSAHAVDSLYDQAWRQVESLTQATPSAGLFWIVSGLVILAAIVGATRVLDEV